MSKGFCLLAQNNSNTNYVRQAYALALSLHLYNKDQKISLITNDDVPTEWQSVFDQIIPIPWEDNAEDSDWKIQNRWKVYHASPYDETIVLEADMMITSDITHWWKELSKRELFFVSNVRTYRDEVITSRFYRKTFDANDAVMAKDAVVGVNVMLFAALAVVANDADVSDNALNCAELDITPLSLFVMEL